MRQIALTDPAPRTSVMRSVLDVLGTYVHGIFRYRELPLEILNEAYRERADAAAAGVPRETLGTMDYRIRRLEQAVRG